MTDTFFGNITAAVFDLDGTLLDTMPFWSELDARFLAKRGIEPVPADYMLAIAHLGAEETAKYTKERFGLPDTPEELVREWHADAVLYYSREADLKPGAREYLEMLHKRGIGLAVATAGSEELYIPALKRLGIYELFGAFASVNECERKKGSPDVYELACKRLGAAVSDTVVFEDIYIALCGARDGGFRTVGVYDKASGRDTELIKAVCDRYITSFTELLGNQHSPVFISGL